MLVASGHWSARKSAQLVALGGALVVLIYVVVRDQEILRFLDRSPWGWPLVAGGAITMGGWASRRRKRATHAARGLPNVASQHSPQMVDGDRDPASYEVDENR
jgi:hypothetical protein